MKFKSYFSRRLFARMRREYPLLWFIPGLIFGQIAAYYCMKCAADLFPAVAVTLVLALSFFAYVKPARNGLAALSMLIGLASFVPLYLSRNQTPLKYESSYLAEIIREPQFPRVGQVRLELDILGEVSSSLQNSFVPFAMPIKALCKGVHLPWRNIATKKLGQRFVMRAKFRQVEPPWNPFAFDATLFRHGFQSTCKIIYSSGGEDFQSIAFISILREFLRQHVFTILGEGERAGLALAMSIGVRNVISDETEAAFKDTGLAHLLVASGYQVTLLFFSICFLLRLAIARFSQAQYYDNWKVVVAIGGLSVSLVFVAIVGLEGSILRALFAILFTIATQVFERGTSFLNSILLSFLMVALIWPGCYFEPGIELTFAALLGLALASDRETQRNIVFSYVRACCFACIATSIVALAWFGRISIWTFILNLSLAPFGSLVGCKGVLVALALHLCGLDSEGFVLRAAAWILEYYSALIFYLSTIPGTNFELEGATRIAVMGVLCLILLVLAFNRLRRYNVEYNLDKVESELLRNAENVHVL